MGRWTDEPEEGGWPVLLPSDLGVVQGSHELVTEAQTIMRQQAKRIAMLERERALLLRYVRLTDRPVSLVMDANDLAELRATRRALIDAGLLGGDDGGE